MNTLLEILKIQQELLTEVVNTWDPKVNSKLLKLDDLFQRAYLEQEIHIQNMKNSEKIK